MLWRFYGTLVNMLVSMKRRNGTTFRRNSVGALAGQVKNGGITQFFWNCPDLMIQWHPNCFSPWFGPQVGPQLGRRVP